MSSEADTARRLGLGEYGPGGAFYNGPKEVKKAEAKVEKIEQEIEEQKGFKCDICGAKFDYKIALAGHSKKHAKELSKALNEKEEE